MNVADIEQKIKAIYADENMQYAYKVKRLKFYAVAKLYLETKPTLEYLIAKARDLQDKKDMADMAIKNISNNLNLSYAIRIEKVEEISKSHRLPVICEQLKMIKFLLD